MGEGGRKEILMTNDDFNTDAPRSWPEVLKFWRERRGLTQREAAVFFEVGMRTYQRWEEGGAKPVFKKPEMVEDVFL